jgi:hypothetical protein
LFFICHNFRCQILYKLKVCRMKIVQQLFSLLVGNLQVNFQNQYPNIESDWLGCYVTVPPQTIGCRSLEMFLTCTDSLTEMEKSHSRSICEIVWWTRSQEMTGGHLNWTFFETIKRLLLNVPLNQFAMVGFLSNNKSFLVIVVTLGMRNYKTK